MAVTTTINGVTSSSSTASAIAGIDSSQLNAIYKLLSDSQKIIEKKISESKKLDDREREKYMDSAYELLSKQSEEFKVLLSSLDSLTTTFDSLSESQKKIIAEQFNKDLLTTMESLRQVPKELSEFSFLLKDKRVSGGTEFRRLIQSVDVISKNVNDSAQKVKEAMDYNKSIERSRNKLKGDILGEDWSSGLRGLGKSALLGGASSALGAFGPLGPFLRPIGSFLQKEAPTILGALKRKKTVLGPVESDILKNGGNEGKAIVWQTRELKKAIGEDDSSGLLGSLSEGLTGSGGLLGTLKNIATAVWGTRNNILTKANIGQALKLGLAGIIIGVSVKEFIGGAKEAIDGLLSGKSAGEVGEDAGEGKSFWNPLIVPGVAGSVTATTLWGAGQGFSKGFKFGLDTPGILPVVAAPTFGLYDASLGGTNSFIGWFNGFSDSVDLSGPFKLAENLGIPGGKAIGTWGGWVDEGYAAYGDLLQNTWDQLKALMSWSGSKGREAGEAMELAFNGGIPLDSTGGLSEDTLKELQTLYFLLQQNLEGNGALSGIFTRNLSALGISSKLIQEGLSPDEQRAIFSSDMYGQYEALKSEYADLLLSSSEFDKRKESIAEALGIGTEENPVVVSLDEQSKQDIADNISKNAGAFILSPPSLSFDFSSVRV